MLSSTEFFLQFRRPQETLYCFSHLPKFELRETTVHMRFLKRFIYLNRSLKVVNRMLVVTHLLINKTSFDKYRFVLFQNLHHARELHDCVVEVTNLSVHKALMEPSRFEFRVTHKRIAETLNRLLDQDFLCLTFGVLRLNFLCLGLIGKTFSVIVLRAALIQQDRSVIIAVSLLKVF